MRYSTVSTFFFTFLLSMSLLALTATSVKLTPAGPFGLGHCGAGSPTVSFELIADAILTTSQLQLYTTISSSVATPGVLHAAALSSICPSAPTGGIGLTAVGVLNPTDSKIITFSLKANDLMGAACTAPAVSQPMAVCLYSVASFPGGAVSGVVGGGAYSFDTLIPAGNIDNVAESDKEISFTITSNKATIKTYSVCFGLSHGAPNDIKADGCGGRFNIQNSDNKNITLKDLINHQEYVFKIQLTDNSGSQGAWSEPKTATPFPMASPLQQLDLPDDPISASCQSTKSPSTGISFALVALLLWRPRRYLNRGFLFLVMAGTLFSTAVLSDAGQISLSLQGSPYLPHIDGSKKTDGSGLGTPIYQNYFDNSWLPLMGIDLNVHLTDAFGSIQAGMSVGYTYANGAGRKISPDNTVNWGEKIGSVALHMLHLKPHITYIFDRYIDTVPLAPFARVGLVGVGYLFTANGGADTSSQDQGRRPLGARFGYEFGGGLDFLLDVLEPDVAGRARAGGVYDHTFLRAEIAYMSVDNFRSPGLNFSPIGLFASPLPLLFTAALVIEFQ